MNLLFNWFKTNLSLKAIQKVRRPFFFLFDTCKNYNCARMRGCVQTAGNAFNKAMHQITIYQLLFSLNCSCFLAKTMFSVRLLSITQDLVLFQINEDAVNTRIGDFSAIMLSVQKLTNHTKPFTSYWLASRRRSYFHHIYQYFNFSLYRNDLLEFIDLKEKSNLIKRL